MSDYQVRNWRGWHHHVTLTGQKLWALSIAEWNAVAGDAQAWSDGYFWLRSPDVDLDSGAFVGYSGGNYGYSVVSHSFAVRPASDLR